MPSEFPRYTRHSNSGVPLTQGIRGMSAKLVEAAVIARVEKKRMALRTVVAVDVKELVYAAKAVDGKKLAE